MRGTSLSSIPYPKMATHFRIATDLTYSRTRRTAGIPVVGLFDARSGRGGPSPDAHVGNGSRPGESQAVVFAAEIFFPSRSLTICAIFRARAAKCPKINGIEV